MLCMSEYNQVKNGTGYLRIARNLQGIHGTTRFSDLILVHDVTIKRAYV